MSRYGIHIPDFIVKGMATGQEARAAAIKKIVNNKAGMSVTLLGGVPSGGGGGTGGGGGGGGSPAGSVTWFPTAITNDGGWTNPDNVFAEDGVFATISTAESIEIRFTDFLGGVIPSGATIEHVRLVYDCEVESVDASPKITAHLYANGVELPTQIENDVEVAGAIQTFDVDYSGDESPWTLALLESAAVILRVRNVDEAPPATDWSLDDVRLEIDYAAVGDGGGGDVGGGSGPGTLAAIVAGAGLTLMWSDNCLAPDPLVALKYHSASMQAVGRVDEAIEYPDDLSSPDPIATSPFPRFQQFSSGGASGGGRYKFFAPAGDTIYSDGGRGRSSLDYPKFNPGNEPAHIGPEGGTHAGFFYEGRRYITAFSLRLPPGYDLDPPIDWRVLVQWKRNEWYNTTDPDDSPVLALEQKGDLWMIRNLGITEPVWAVDASGMVNQWTRWIMDTTYSQDPDIGRFRIHADFNNDGIYEYDSGVVAGIQTLTLGSNVIEAGLPGPVAARFPAQGIESSCSWGMYEADGGDFLEVCDGFIFGVPGG